MIMSRRLVFVCYEGMVLSLDLLVKAISSLTLNFIASILQSYMNRLNLAVTQSCYSVTCFVDVLLKTMDKYDHLNFSVQLGAWKI